ncbi:MAG: hypothetical protein OHK0022_11750 [Roseiflexaceae bacterium]
MRAIIMAGGQGLRLQPYTMVLPKPLIPLDDMPILQIVLMQLYSAGVRHVTLTLCYKAQQIVRYFGDGSWLGLTIEYAISENFLGTAGPLALIKSFVEPTLVLNADILTNVDFGDVYAAHQHSGALATMVTYQNRIRIPYGVVQTDQHGRLQNIQEKPEHTYQINTGIYVLNPHICAAMIPGQHYDMPQLLQHAVEQGQLVQTYTFTGEWIDIGTTDQFRHAQDLFRRQRDHYLPIHRYRLSEATQDIDLNSVNPHSAHDLSVDNDDYISLWR